MTKQSVLIAALLLIFGQTYANDALTISDLFRAGMVDEIGLSPDGALVAYESDNRIAVGNNEYGYYYAYELADDQYVRELSWIGPETIAVVTRQDVSGKTYLRVAKIIRDDEGGIDGFQHNRHSIRGYIHDALPEDPDNIVYARIKYDDDETSTELFRINVFEDTDKAFRRRNKIKTGSTDFYYYLKDSAGEFSVGIRFVDGVPEVWRKQPGDKNWTHVWTAPDESVFIPEQFTSDGRSIWALSNAFTDKKAAIEFNLETGTLTRVLYEHDRFDLGAILMSANDQMPRGVTYKDQGMVEYHFFEDDARSDYESLQAHFPDKGLVIIGRSLDESVRLVLASTSRDPGQIHQCIIDTDECERIISIKPWLDDKSLSDTIVLEVPTPSGHVIEAFLTLPQTSAESVALIALPHGGPIGISDNRYFSPGVQWLAHNGYAVLQVNYRGSAGYGQEFVAAGLRQWGRGIEDDIEAAINLALDRYSELDRNRVGIYGSSYGGYSALMSMIRNPDLFKCAASFAGVTDLTLLFTQSRMHKNEALREDLIRKIGRPTVDYDEQTENSPVYRYKEITRPVFLAHGTDDSTVDVEHSWRLRMLLRLIDRDPDFVIIDGAAHGFAYVSEAEELYGPLITFLDKHLARTE